MLKTGLIKVKSIENEEIIMIMTKVMTTTVTMEIIILIKMIMRMRFGNHIKI